MSRRTVCRWGILGTAGIARKNWHAIHLAGNARVEGVASRDVERASRFIAECLSDAPAPSTPAAYGSYEELLRRDDIDAVYIPLPTGLRKEWVLRAAACGKHILCEKPVGISTAEVQEMLAACRLHGVQFMDGVMFMHSGRLPALRQILDDGQSVGPLRRITSHFSFRAPAEFVEQNIRAHSALEPMGCLGDLGWYNTRLTLWALGWQLPERVSGRLLAQQGGSTSPQPVPMEFSAELLFPGQVSAGFFCSFLAENQQWAVLSGTHGYAHLRDFVLPFYGSEVDFTVSQHRFHAAGCHFNMEQHTRRHVLNEYSNNAPTAQEANLFRTFSKLVLDGRVDPVWGEIALRTQQVLDALLRSSQLDGQFVAVEPPPPPGPRPKPEQLA